jgi:hypothetical protein
MKIIDQLLFSLHLFELFQPVLLSLPNQCYRFDSLTSGSLDIREHGHPCRLVLFLILLFFVFSLLFLILLSEFHLLFV